MHVHVRVLACAPPYQLYPEAVVETKDPGQPDVEENRPHTTCANVRDIYSHQQPLEGEEGGRREGGKGGRERGRDAGREGGREREREREKEREGGREGEIT